jgi:hypothetical protein
MALHEAAARHRLGTLMGGDEGHDLLLQAEADMHERGVSVPDRYAGMLLPGEWTRIPRAAGPSHDTFSTKA